MTDRLSAWAGAEYADSIDKALANWLDGQPDYLGGFYDMMREQLGMVGGTSSSHRAHEWGFGPFLSLLTAEALGGGRADALPASAALALLFASLRIHDDIERHHLRSADRPALWTRWGMPQAINTGDALISLSANAMVEAVDDAPAALALVRELAATSLSFTGGQHMLLRMEARSGQAGTYVEALELTSGALGGFSAWVGALLAGVGEDVRAALRSFGEDLGVAFALRHDVLAEGSHISTAEVDIRRRLERALSHLETAAMADQGRKRLVAFARDVTDSMDPA